MQIYVCRALREKTWSVHREPSTINNGKSIWWNKCRSEVGKSKFAGPQFMYTQWSMDSSNRRDEKRQWRQKITRRTSWTMDYAVCALVQRGYKQLILRIHLSSVLYWRWSYTTYLHNGHINYLQFTHKFWSSWHYIVHALCWDSTSVMCGIILKHSVKTTICNESDH